MEDTLRATIKRGSGCFLIVLILVLMEDTLRDKEVGYLQGNKIEGLNPCFNGRYSQRYDIEKTDTIRWFSLNPCFNGRYSQRHCV